MDVVSSRLCIVRLINTDIEEGRNMALGMLCANLKIIEALSNASRLGADQLRWLEEHRRHINEIGGKC